MSIIDPFGPTFKYSCPTCPICCESTTDTSRNLKEFVILPCNFGEERAVLIDKIITEIGAAYREGRQLPWLNEWMQIDPEKLINTPLISSQERQLFQPSEDVSKQLLTKEGYINLAGLHGGCHKCVQDWTRQRPSCPTCRAVADQQFVSEYLNKKIQTNSVGINRPSSPPIGPQPLNDQVRGFFDDVKGMFGSLTRSVIGGGGKMRSEHLQICMHRMDRIVSVAINGLIHNILFHGAVKMTLLAFQRFGFQGLGSWVRLADSSIEWNLSWTQHVLIWKAFVSAFEYSFRQFSVNLSYTALSHHVIRLDLLALLWLSFKVIYRLDFGWSA